MLTRVLPSFDELDDATLDKLEQCAIAAEVQRQNGGKDWPTKPCRQRLELFLACKPKTVLALINMARRAINAANQ
jgi:hypothetical protein